MISMGPGRALIKIKRTTPTNAPGYPPVQSFCRRWHELEQADPYALLLIFLPTLYRLLAEGQPLPGRCGIAPMAQEYFRGLALASATLEQTLLKMDRILSLEEGGG